MSSPYVETMKEGAAMIGRSFTRPDDDWVPALLCVNEKGEVAIVDVAVFFENDASKRVLGEVVLPTLVEDMAVQEFVLVTSSWFLQMSADEYEAGYVRPRDNPDRMEVLVISHITAEQITQHHAAINRDPRGGTAPTLGDWEQIPGETGGPLVEAAQTALQERRKGK